MRVRTGILIIIVSMLFLIGTVEAVGIPDSVTVTTDKPWIIANNGDMSTITVTVTNTTAGFSGGVPNAIVNLVVDPVYGTLSPATITTNAAGVASSTFRVKTKSGAVQITATINAPTISGSIIQNIDHEVPAIAVLQYPLEGEVGSIISFNVSVIDRWGNPIDGRNPSQIHSVSLRIDGPTNDCGFKDGALYPQTLTRNLNINGNLSLQVRLSKIIGDNNIQISSPFTLTRIVGIATGVPVSMSGSHSKVGGEGLANDEVRANNADYFIFKYVLKDANGNPVQNRSLSVYTNVSGESIPKMYTTNSFGEIQITYGPKISILTPKVIATSTDNVSVRNEMVVKFINSGEATNLVLVVTPQTMASRDTDPTKTTQMARVVGIITDRWGNPMPYQDVTFTISNTITAPYNKTTDYTGDPSFNSGSIVQTATSETDSNGNAILTFYPGAFEAGEEGATGSCKISATSGTLTSNDVIVEWKNFPYLSVTVNATPQTVRRNDPIDVTIRITGDGYKMVQMPITVVLDLDTTSNLNAVSAGDKDTNGLPRFDNEKFVSQNFVGTMSSQDQVGLVTYGYYPNNQYWQLINNLSYNHDQVNTSIGSLINQGGLNVSIRDSIHEAVTRIITNPLRPDGEVAAIITIGDSSYKAEDFAPMVQETWTDNNIRVYSILYVSSLNNCDGNYAQDLTALTTAAHGKFYCNNTREKVMEALDDIKQNLSTIAGVDTSMDLNFEHVTVDSEPVDAEGNISYVFVGPESSPQPVVNPNGRTSIIWTDGNQSVVNQTDDWNTDFKLNFTIGTIRIKQTWETTFRLRINQTGLIQLFGPGSSISYNGGTGNLNLPETYIHSLTDDTPLGLGQATLDLSDLKVSGAITDSIPFQWNLSYTGSATATETISYSYNNGYYDGPWVHLTTRTNNLPSNVTAIHTAQLNIQGIDRGSYRIKVHADTPDAGSDEMIIGTGQIGSRNATLLLK